MKLLLKIGSVFFLLQVLWFVSFQSDVFLIGKFLTPEDVTTFVISWKVFSVPIPIIGSLVLPLWPKISRLHSERRDTSIYTLFIDQQKKILLWIVPFCLLLALAGNELIWVWTKKQIDPPDSLMISLAIWVLISALVQPITMLLYGISDWKFLNFFAVIYTSVSVCAGGILVKFTGNSSGVIWAKSLVLLVFLFVPMSIRLQKWKRDV